MLAFLILPLVSATVGRFLFIRQDQPPTCSDGCLAGLEKTTTCNPNNNLTCLCIEPVATGYLVSCLDASCNSADRTEAQSYFSELCQAGGFLPSGFPSVLPSLSSTSSAPAASSVSGSSTDSGSTVESSVPSYSPSGTGVESGSSAPASSGDTSSTSTTTISGNDTPSSVTSSTSISPSLTSTNPAIITPTTLSHTSLSTTSHSFSSSSHSSVPAAGATAGSASQVLSKGLFPFGALSAIMLIL
ncbi:hypothetical protein M231_04417 [Tremella mesenterica]|uniref:CFEM domain-containing protein n=1 Tax=Tremella mesenterica TaxID=5217 RepID=A0A4Q1BKJ1_TREME|nr:uncharacterized protein TREMEDRAFT_73505 [Tremella mesenterica DSM 1558]EIW70560.1 hypothetical protein TREMEDRAFT_73505 [Tremella mesenterica DSM 1558]RXK38245.1 hypothetical protein M231_04417 [Tremella mesenterica]